MASGCAGLLATILTGGEPGLILAVFLVSGTMAAVLGVRRGAVHLVIPVPALAYLVAAIIAGLFHDPSATASRTAFMIDALQWIAAGFTGMAVATFIAIAVTLLRKPRRRRVRPAADDSLRQAW